jgi:hypothetical protein
MQKTFFLIIVILLTGCGGGYTKNETKFLETRYEYAHKQKRSSSIDLEVNKKLNNGVLSGNIYSNYVIPQQSYDIYEEREKYGNHPDMGELLQILNPMFYIINVMTGDFREFKSAFSNLVGDSGEWTSSKVEKNRRNTGQEKTGRELAGSSQIKVCLSERKTTLPCNAFDAQNGKFSIDLKPLVLQFPQRPQSVDINLEASRQGQRDRIQLSAPQQLISGMGLKNGLWVQQEYEASLPVAIRKKYYAEQLVKAMNGQDWVAAIEWHDKIEKLQADLNADASLVTQDFWSGMEPSYRDAFMATGEKKRRLQEEKQRQNIAEAARQRAEQEKLARLKAEEEKRLRKEKEQLARLEEERRELERQEQAEFDRRRHEKEEENRRALMNTFVNSLNEGMRETSEMLRNTQQETNAAIARSQAIQERNRQIEQQKRELARREEVLSAMGVCSQKGGNWDSANNRCIYIVADPKVEERRKSQEAARKVADQKAEERRKNEELARKAEHVSDSTKQSVNGLNSEIAEDDGCWSGRRPNGDPCIEYNTYVKDDTTYFKISNVCDQRLYIRWCAGDRCGVSGLRGGATTTEYERVTNVSTKVWAVGSNKSSYDWVCNDRMNGW